jgi:nucleoid DNA-binding protein
VGAIPSGMAAGCAEADDVAGGVGERLGGSAAGMDKLKSQLVARMAQRVTHIKPSRVETYVNGLLGVMAERLTAQDVIYIEGFGTFSAEFQNGRVVSVPVHPGVQGSARRVVEVGAGRLPKFTPANSLADAVEALGV